MSVSITSYEDRQRHKADISNLKLTATERKRWIMILEELVMNGGSSEDKATVLNLLNGSETERRELVLPSE